MPVPVLLPTAARDESYGGVRYHIQGELVPALSIELSGMPVYFEHHVLLWKDPQVQVSGAAASVPQDRLEFCERASKVAGRIIRHAELLCILL
ncbi:MAG TPA: hypothetical protein VMI06_07280 [Terriglobia bacterium]|nr:hypothetical protein [Terriglobia bacterium]